MRLEWGQIVVAPIVTVVVLTVTVVAIVTVRVRKDMKTRLTREIINQQWQNQKDPPMMAL